MIVLRETLLACPEARRAWETWWVAALTPHGQAQPGRTAGPPADVQNDNPNLALPRARVARPGPFHFCAQQSLAICRWAAASSRFSSATPRYCSTSFSQCPAIATFAELGPFGAPPSR